MDDMTYAHWAVCFILGCIGLGILWDVVVVVILNSGPSICHACRDLNQWSDGLFALTWLALTLHIFFKAFLPSSWVL